MSNKINSVQVSGATYSVIPQKVEVLTSAPSTDSSEPTEKQFVVLSSVPSARKVGYIYIITEE